MVGVIVDQAVFADDSTFESRATGLGRYIHALADRIESAATS